jgi:transcriptional regulator GlxA family with amidase domain
VLHHLEMNQSYALSLRRSSFRGSIMTTPRNQRYRGLVDRFERVARVNIETFARVVDLCRIADVNQRTLSRAFRVVRGTTPHHYLQALRLGEVKRVLSSEGGSVTQAAMRFGFRELGRFAMQYRMAFGESPSETKRRGSVRARGIAARRCVEVS